jgi:hypothetical protein
MKMKTEKQKKNAMRTRRVGRARAIQVYWLVMNDDDCLLCRGRRGFRIRTDYPDPESEIRIFFDFPDFFRAGFLYGLSDPVRPGIFPIRTIRSGSYGFSKLF